MYKEQVESDQSQQFFFFFKLCFDISLKCYLEFVPTDSFMHGINFRY